MLEEVGRWRDGTAPSSPATGRGGSAAQPSCGGNLLVEDFRFTDVDIDAIPAGALAACEAEEEAVALARGWRRVMPDGRPGERVGRRPAHGARRAADVDEPLLAGTVAADFIPADHVSPDLDGAGGPGLAYLCDVDPGPLKAGALVDVVAATERLKAWADAQQLAALAALTDRCVSLRGVGDRFDEIPAEVMAAAEAGPALGVSPRAAVNRVGLAQVLRRLPTTRAALREGRINLAKARVVTEVLVPLTDEQAREVERQVLERHAGSTALVLKNALQRAVLAIDPGAADERHEEAVKGRGVWRAPREDGIGRLEWLAPADQIEAAHLELTELARAAQAADRDAAHAARSAGEPVPDVRSLDQCRSDALADLLLDPERRAAFAAMLRNPPHDGEPAATDGSAGAEEATPRHETQSGETQPGETQHGETQPGETQHGETQHGETQPGETQHAGARRAQIHVVVGIGTLLGLDDLPGELPGYGPVPASMARRIAVEGTWRRLLTDPQGRVLDVSTQAHDPPADLAAYVRARDRTCRFFGCRMPAVRCDLDHNVEHPAGSTHAANLCCLCRTHHRIKTLTETRLVNDGSGVITWTMPSGKTWTTEPPQPLDGRGQPAGEPQPRPAPVNPSDDVPPF